jgi:hypothetical protein
MPRFLGCAITRTIAGFRSRYDCATATVSLGTVTPTTISTGKRVCCPRRLSSARESHFSDWQAVMATLTTGVDSFTVLVSWPFIAGNITLYSTPNSKLAGPHSKSLKRG